MSTQTSLAFAGLRWVYKNARTLYTMPTSVYRPVLLLRLICVSVLASVWLTSPAQAITLKGSHSCEEWRETRVEAAAGKQAARLNEITAKYWVIGYLSALAGVQADNLRNDPLKATSNEKIYGSIDLYCADNPDRQLPDAIVALWLDIAKFKKAKKK